jgi:CheY-like chemotaxis protein/PAS domain-containing protein
MEFGGMDNWRAKEVARLLSLVESERRYFQDILANLPAAVAIISADLSVLISNRSFRRLFGPAGHEGGRGLDDLISGGGLREAVGRVLEGGSGGSIEYAGVHTRVGVRHLRITLRPFADWESTEPQVILIVDDLTEVTNRLRGEVEVAAASARGMLDSLPGVAWEVDPGPMSFTTVNEPAARRMGLPVEHWRNGAPFWSARVDPSDAVRVRAIYQIALGGGQLRSCDYRARDASGVLMWLRDLPRFIRDESGAVTRIEGFTIDITAERRMLGAAQHAATGEAIARLSARMAHEGNNLLTILSGYGEDLLHGLPADNPLRANAQEILRAGDRLSALLGELTAISSRPAVETRAVPVEPFLTSLHASVAGALPPGVELQLDLGTAGAAMRTDPGFLERLIRTLVGGAVERMPKGGSIALRSRFEEIAEASGAADFPVEPGTRVSIQVHDSGLAIHPVTLARLFEPGESVETVRTSLAPMYLTTLDCGGSMRVESAHQLGTVFYISFPVAAPASAEPQAPAAAQPVAPKAPTSAGVVLVVEDEPGIRTLIRKTLQRSGFDVLEAASGQEALDRARDHDGPIHLLLTDVVMPMMGGVELAQAIAPLRKGIRVLFISGYSGPTGVETGSFPAGAAFLQKPFTLAALLSKVKELLSRRESSGASV